MSVNEQETKRAIEESLRSFAVGNLADNARSLFATLGYRVDKTTSLETPTAQSFLDSFAEERSFNRETALVKDWQFVDLLFQLTKDEITGSNQLRIAFGDSSRVDNTIIESYLFFAIALERNTYTRTELAGITREINKLFPMPVMVVFLHGQALTLSIIDRRLNKRDESKDVLRKVTLIKDIAFASPHRAHTEILFDLSLEQLYKVHKFTNFVELHRAWQKTLDSSELNKRFFREVSNWYFWATQNVVFPAGAETDEEVRNMTSLIRLITRLIFVWFLKEKSLGNKPLVPEELFQRSHLTELIHFDDPNSSTYYKAILQNLFFATLNQEMNTLEKPENRKFRHKGKSRDQHYMVHNVYRYQDLFKQPEEALKLFEQVPFLNGGLFECLDYKDLDRPEKIIRVDGFSDRADNPISIPNYLFFSDKQKVDLSKFYETKNKLSEVRGLIDIFNSYKFTITENTPIEEEIALDPELLGKVFENLLASYNSETRVTARKQTGSFYTPREVVDYMVDESLLVYLATQMMGAGLVDEADRANLENRLRQLLDYKSALQPFEPQEVVILIRAIDQLKSLDPAVGSGAFPMGLLQKLVFVLGKLDPNNEQWKHEQREKRILPLLQDIQQAKSISFEAARKAAIKELQEELQQIEAKFRDNEMDYPRKLFLIENCIYGVDIQPIAVQIAKLRFFISLIVEQRVDELKPNRGIEPLPNLETKLIAANTLMELKRWDKFGQAQLAFRDSEIQEIEAKLEESRHWIFNARSPQTKQKHRQRDRELRTRLAELLKKEGLSGEIAMKLAHWNPFDQNASATFFDPEWMFGVKDGFDILIGNPPYIRIQELKQSMPDAVAYFKARYEAAKKGNYDLYVVFVERGLELLSSRGNFAFIMPHKFFNAQYGEGLRGLLSKGKHLRKIVHFGEHQVFTTATTYVCLLFLNKFSTQKFTFVKVDDPEKWIEQGSSQVEVLSSDKASEREWNFTIGEATFLVDRLNQVKTKLENASVRIFQGLKTSADKVYILERIEEQGNTTKVYSRQLDHECWLETELLHPLIKGGDSEPYHISTTNLRILFPYSSSLGGKTSLISAEILQNKYPLAWKYLLLNKTFLESRENGRFSGSHWFSYGRSQALDIMPSPKLFTPDIALNSSFSFDVNGDLFFTGGVSGGYGIKPSSTYSPYYLLGLLNSKLLEWLLQRMSTQMRGGYYSYESRFIKNLPILKMEPPTSEKTFVHIVQYIVFLKEKFGVNSPLTAGDSPINNLMIDYFEKIINGLVYELYLPEDLHAHGFTFANHLQAENLPALDATKGDKLEALRAIFQRLYAQDHPIRQNLFALDTLPVIRLIEGKA